MNGLGPWWFPSACRKALSRIGSAFFIEASWDKHDEGYHAGDPSRRECDRKFLQAMLRDASLAPSIFKMLGCTLMAWTFWALVRAFGWASYNRR